MLSIRDVAYSYGSQPILKEVTFAVDDGERVALVGQNGAGKSTLLSIIAKERLPDGGSIEMPRLARMGILAQEPNLPLDKTVREVVQMGLGLWREHIDAHTALCKKMEDVNLSSDELETLGLELSKHSEAIEHLGGFDVSHRVDGVLARLGLPIGVQEKLVSELSGGERRRVDLARLLLSAPDIMLLDEPTNHLDVSAVRFLGEELKSRGQSVLFISHDRAFLDDVASRIVEVDQGRAYTHPAPYAAFLENKLTRQEITSRTLNRQERLMARELAWLRAGTPARTTKQQARIDRAESLISEVEEGVRAQRERVLAVQRGDIPRLAKTIVEFKNVSLERGGKKLFSNFNRILVEGERWGIVGKNGAGKTSLLLAIQKLLEPTEGTVVVGQHTKIGIFDQHRRQLPAEEQVGDFIGNGSDYVTVGSNRQHIASYLEKFMFESGDRYRRIGTLSGGEQNRLLLAKMFLQEPNCLLLDEPTNDLDVTTLAVLEDILIEHPGVALIVSHDRRFLDRVATGIISFDEAPPKVQAQGIQSVLSAYQGSYSTYERLAAQNHDIQSGSAASGISSTGINKQTDKQAEKQADKTKADNAGAASEQKKKKRSFNEEREYQQIEGKILELEEKREQMQNELQDGALFTVDSKRATQLTQELAELDEKIEKMYARWQELES